MTDLKPCPFCGRYYGDSMEGNWYEDLEVEEVPMKYPPKLYHVICKNCNAYGPIERNKERAIEQWNRRLDE